MITKGEVFNGCVMILCTVCGSKALYSHNREVKRCGYLPAVRYPGQCLCLPYKFPVNINEVNDWDETVWMWKGICPVCHVYAHSAWSMPLFPYECTGSCLSHDDGVCLVTLYQLVLLCEVFCLSHGSFFLCAVVFWHLLMSSLVGTWSLIDCWDQCMFRFISYLIIG